MLLFTGSRLKREKKKKNQGCNTKDTAVGSGRELFLDQGKKKEKKEREKKQHFWILQSNLVPFLRKQNPIDGNFHTI